MEEENLCAEKGLSPERGIGFERRTLSRLAVARS